MTARTGIFSIVAASAMALPASAAESAPATVAGVWKGEWTSPEGHLHHVESHWDVSAAGAVEGYLLWTLKRSPRPKEQAKRGLTGKEFVKGQFNAACGVLSLKGYKQEDPHDILGLDRYRLVLSEHGRVLTGPTRHGGNWRGVLSLRR